MRCAGNVDSLTRAQFCTSELASKLVRPIELHRSIAAPDAAAAAGKAVPVGTLLSTYANDICAATIALVRNGILVGEISPHWITVHAANVPISQKEEKQAEAHKGKQSGQAHSSARVHVDTRGTGPATSPAPIKLRLVANPVGWFEDGGRSAAGVRGTEAAMGWVDARLRPGKYPGALCPCALRCRGVSHGGLSQLLLPSCAARVPAGVVSSLARSAGTHLQSGLQSTAAGGGVRLLAAANVHTGCRCYD